MTQTDSGSTQFRDKTLLKCPRCYERPRPRFDVRHLNYNHLHYFWVVATIGSIAKAARSLHVTPQTISGQIRTLEARVGSALFRRDGRKLKLTETGQTVHAYVDPMFSLAWKLGEALEKRMPQRPAPLSVGVAPALGKSMACRMLGPVLDLAPSTHVRCHEAPTDSLVAAVLAGDIDFAMTDGAVLSRDSARVRSHLVGQCGVTFFSAAAHAERYLRRFPASLDGAPLVMPTRTSMLGRLLAEWLRMQRITPSVVAEIDSPDLASGVCETRMAVFAVPTAIAHEVERKYRLLAVGDVADVEQRFYIVCPERSVRHEVISAVIERARERFWTPSLLRPHARLAVRVPATPLLGEECAV